MKSLSINIGPGGEVTAIYDDAVIPVLKALGTNVLTSRASHVEPCKEGWTADLGPVGGPRLGPFEFRQQALDAEIQWLKQNLDSV